MYIMPELSSGAFLYTKGISEEGLESDGYNQFRPHSSLGYKLPTPEAILVLGVTVDGSIL
jgi:hypothetical protein